MTKRLTTWDVAKISNLLDRATREAFENGEGNQIYRDHLNELANLIGKAKRITVTFD